MNPKFYGNHVNLYRCLLTVHRDEVQEESPHWDEGSTSTGSQQQEQEHEATFPPAPSSSEVLQDPERDVQSYIDAIDNVRLFHTSRFQN